MNARHLFSFLRVAALLATASCSSYELTVRDPVSLAPYSADKNVDANMLTVEHIRMALPEGWHFKRKRKEDDKSVMFWIHDGGNNTVTGNLRRSHLDFPVSVARVAENYGEIAMRGFIDREVSGTDVDNRGAYLLRGKKENTGMERVTMLVADGPKDINDITLVADSNYFTANPQTAFAILNSYKTLPWDLSERRIKGSFSFRCDDGTMEWVDDHKDQFRSKGFTVSGSQGRDYVAMTISQISTKRFDKFLNMDRFNVPEFETEVHLAGTTYKARAISRDSRGEDKTVGTYFIFEHAGQAYVLDVYRKFQESSEIDAKTMHQDETITRILDTYFYFNG